MFIELMLIQHQFDRLLFLWRWNYVCRLKILV